MRPFCDRSSPFCCSYSSSVLPCTTLPILSQCPIDVTNCNDSSRHTSLSYPAVFPCQSTTPTSRSYTPSPVLVSLPTSSRSKRPQPLRKQPCEKCSKIQFERYTAEISNHKQLQHHASISNQVRTNNNLRIFLAISFR
jgi:hypothetical protein